MATDEFGRRILGDRVDTDPGWANGFVQGDPIY
jgi:hypothetical protein